MRIGLFGDIHSNYHALEAVLRDMQQRGVDRMVCLGDITMKGPLPKECVDLVRSLGCPVVQGNTDACFLPDRHPSQFPVMNRSQAEALADFERHEAALTEEDRQWLQNLPLTATDVIDGVRLDYFHAVPHHNYVLVMPWATNDEIAAMRLSDETKVSACGHNHRAFIRSPQGRMVINAGSVGAPFDGDWRPSYAIVELSGGSLSGQIVRVPYSAEAAIQAAKDVRMHGWELFAHTARTGQFPG